MLGKLIKNEFKATSRLVAQIYLVMVLITVFLKVMLEIQIGSESNNVFVNTMVGFLMVTFVLAIITLFLGTVIVIIKRFYDNMLKDQGYLSFTLPVTTGQHLASKILVSYIWIIVSFIVAGIAIIILFLDNAEAWREVSQTISSILDVVKQQNLWSLVIKMILIVVIGLYSNIIIAYTCFSVGQLFNKHRIVGALITYMGIYTVNQIVGVIFMLAVLNMEVTNEMTMTVDMFQNIMTYSLTLSVVESIICTIVTYFMLNKRLNLE